MADWVSVRLFRVEEKAQGEGGGGCLHMGLDLFSGCWFRFDCLFLNNQYKREKWVKIDRERGGELFNFVISRRNERDKTAEVEREFSARERARERQR